MKFKIEEMKENKLLKIGSLEMKRVCIKAEKFDLAICGKFNKKKRRIRSKKRRCEQRVIC